MMGSMSPEMERLNKLWDKAKTAEEREKNQSTNDCT